MSGKTLRTLTVVGARPQFIKVAPVCRAMATHNAGGGPFIEDVLVHTGQHYDDAMSEIFFKELGIPSPAANLEIGSGSHGEQTGRMLIALERVIRESSPDVVIVYGDTNSTLAGALAAAKLNVPVAHIEAGLRSFNRAMPEEINRIVADHLSTILYAPTQTAMEHLDREGMSARSILTGDVMYDAVQFNRGIARRPDVFGREQIREGEYVLVTVHRAENTSETILIDLLETLRHIAKEVCPILFPMHPRTRQVLRRMGFEQDSGTGFHIVEPFGYLENLYAIEHARIVLTDSGGLQKEALFLDVPCITLRNETEWPETVTARGNIVSGTARTRILEAVAHWEAHLGQGRPNFAGAARAAFGSADASSKIVTSIASFVSRLRENGAPIA